MDVLKNRLPKEGGELVTFCNQLIMLASDGKMRLTDCLDTKGVLRLVQAIPSPKAEPFKIELVLNMLAEVTTTAISRQEQPGTFDENKDVARRGVKVAKNARQYIETQLGQTVISPLNASDKPALEISADNDTDNE